MTLSAPLALLFCAGAWLPSPAPHQSPSSIGAQEHAPAPRSVQEPSAEVDERTQKIKRVLHLGGGATLRCLCYFDAGAWQVRRDGNWIAVDAAAVVSWRDEAEVEARARELRKSLGPGDHGLRVEFADWLLHEGLTDEALEELDRVLHLEPDFAAALELLETGAFPRPSGGDPDKEPEAVARRLVAAGTSAGPVRRELLIQRLGELRQTPRGGEVLRASLRRELVSPRILQRTFAAHALRRLMPGEELFPIMRRCVLDTSRPVREESARALRATGEPGIVIPLVKALGSDSRAVRTNAVESLGNAGFASAVPTLVNHFSNLPQSSGGGIAKTTAHIHIGTHFAYVGDFDLEIAQGASIADPMVFQGEEAVILDARVGGVSGYTYVREYRGVYSALKQLTGANPGSSPSDWERWYGENKGRFEGQEAEGAE